MPQVLEPRWPVPTVAMRLRAVVWAMRGAEAAASAPPMTVLRVIFSVISHNL